jgi:hypothetical protein
MATLARRAVVGLARRAVVGVVFAGRFASVTAKKYAKSLIHLERSVYPQFMWITLLIVLERGAHALEKVLSRYLAQKLSKFIKYIQINYLNNIRNSAQVQIGFTRGLSLRSVKCA